jgi:hypothetical protein
MIGSPIFYNLQSARMHAYFASLASLISTASEHFRQL